MELTNVLGFLIAFGLLAALVGTLATGVLRVIGFGVLVTLALIIGAPYFRDTQVNVQVPFGQQTQTPRPQTTTRPQTTQRPAPVQTIPSNVGSATTFSTTGPVENETTSTARQQTQTTTGGGSQRGVPAMW